jgi:nucleoside ABC transporter ATP-binding protein
VLLDQPTRGLDVGSIEFIHRSIIEMREANRAILLISADLDELMRLADRIYVMRNGKIEAELDPKKVSKEDVGAYMLGAHE